MVKSAVLSTLAHKGEFGLKWLQGYVVCQSHKGSCERFMNMCRHHGILLWGVKREHAVEFCVCVKDFKKMKPIVYKTKLHPQIKKKRRVFLFISGE
ncbi:MAG: sporulation protein YqfD [Clostridium sp.]